MKARILATMALAAGMMLAGCSKDENGNMEEVKGQTEQQDYFEEPILDFSLTQEQLKTRETHTLLSDKAWATGENDPQDAINPWLAQYSYPTVDGDIITTYYWTDKDNGNMYAIVMDWSGDKGVSTNKIRQQMTSHYGAARLENGEDVRYSNGVKIIENTTSIVYYHVE